MLPPLRCGAGTRCTCKARKRGIPQGLGPGGQLHCQRTGIERVGDNIAVEGVPVRSAVLRRGGRLLAPFGSAEYLLGVSAARTAIGGEARQGNVGPGDGEDLAVLGPHHALRGGKVGRPASGRVGPQRGGTDIDQRQLRGIAAAGTEGDRALFRPADHILGDRGEVAQQGQLLFGREAAQVQAKERTMDIVGNVPAIFRVVVRALGVPAVDRVRQRCLVIAVNPCERLRIGRRAGGLREILEHAEIEHRATDQAGLVGAGHPGPDRAVRRNGIHRGQHHHVIAYRALVDRQIREARHELYHAPSRDGQRRSRRTGIAVEAGIVSRRPGILRRHAQDVPTLFGVAGIVGDQPSRRKAATAGVDHRTVDDAIGVRRDRSGRVPIRPLLPVACTALEGSIAVIETGPRTHHSPLAYWPMGRVESKANVTP